LGRSAQHWTDDNIRLIREHFVTCAVPTQIRNSNTPEGEFIRACGCQWVTSSGYMDVVSAGGTHLGHFPSPQILETFRKLPAEDRSPKILDLAPGELTVPAPPKNGLILRVHTRAMSRDERGDYRPVSVEDYPLVEGDPERFEQLQSIGNFGPNVDSMWLTEAEWRSLVPADAVAGQRVEAPAAIAERLVRFHLVPHKMVGGTGHWSKREFKEARLTLIVENAGGDRLRIRVEGFAHVGSEYDAKKATSPNGTLPRGYEAPIYGFLEYDCKRALFTRFDLIALGDVWGRWGDANNNSMAVERPARNPVLIAFELATGDSPTNRIPPGGWDHFFDLGYFGAQD
jgi:hypothetical protein